MQTSGVSIALYVFMGLSGVLGATTYVGAKGASEMKHAAASYSSESSALQSQKSAADRDFNTLKEQLGFADEDEKIIESIDADVASALGDVDGVATYRDAILSLGNVYKRAVEEDAVYQNLDDQATIVADNHKTMAESQQAEFDKTMSDLDLSHKKSMDSATSSQDKLNDSLQAQKNDLDALVAATEKEEKQKKQETADNKEALEGLVALNRTLSARVDELGNKDFERADGEVVYSDQVLKIARINVGSADGVRPLTTFNVFPSDSLDMNTDKAKGSVQVVRTIGPHLSEAKILEEEIANPVMGGDLIYTPLWRPGKVMRYALDYNLDIDGDGLSDLDQVMNLIISSGAEVAAYIDDEGKQHGEITNSVYRLVRANENIVDVLSRDSSRNEAAREKLQNLEAQFLKDAKTNNVPEIMLDDFLVSVGYKETAKITRYREEGGVDLQDNGAPIPDYARNPIAPIHEIEPDHAPVSTGINAPIYKKDAQPAPVSDGKVSDYYFRKRSSKSE